MASPVIRGDLGDGKQRRLFLSIDELKQIKRETGRGFYSLYTGFSKDAEPEEVRAVLRLALIGGGLDPQQATELTDFYCAPPRPLKRVYLLAYECLGAAWNGMDQSGGETADGVLGVAAVDSMFDEIEAKLLKEGLDPAFMRNRSLAELQELMRLLSGKNKVPPPDKAMFSAIRNTIKG